ncbi:MAG: hypothetical protein RBS16_07830 [Candidatus Cloacimonadales bacterium]|jgi:hypothetical protein|nr:hypothetical protein [Candidatus Cloacimonadota bacterium]MDD2649590.1 hypothetical protein [Candidatus Cloacimonadota bacterium]MDX9977924.1 hypothetical protein [Candidatus Cloacimonadales bacterium]
MQIKFRDVNYGIVEARAVIQLEGGLFLNEITILRKDNEILVELPVKSFKAKDGKIHSMDIITFENDDKKTLFILEVKNAYIEWRKKLRKIRVYDSQ